MSANYIVAGVAAVALVMCNGAAQAAPLELIDYLNDDPTVAADNYIGSNDHNGGYDYNNTDAIGGTEYSIIGASGTRKVAGPTITHDVVVKIYMQYNGNDGTATQLTNFGDLFVNPTWNPNTATKATCPTGTVGMYPCDNYATGTKWQFGITTDGISSTTTKILGAGDSVTGTGSIYYISNTNQVKTSYVIGSDGSGYAWRDGEPVQVNTANSPTVLSADASWTYQAAPGGPTGDSHNPDGLFNVLTYEFNADAIDAKLLTLGQGPIIGANGDYDFAMSWAMTCANDIIQGRIDWAPVPEPSSIAILLAALAGMVGAARLRSRPITA